MMSTATQTYLTNEYLSKKLVTDAVPKTQISSTTATESTELLDTDSKLSYCLTMLTKLRSMKAILAARQTSS